MSATIRSLALLVAALPMAACLDSSPRGVLQVQLFGPPPSRPRCAKGPVELGRVNSLGDPVTGARVELSPGGIFGSSDTEGLVTFDALAADTYQVRVTAAGFGPADGVGQVKSGSTTTLQVGMEPCVSAGADKTRVGFDTDVELTASTKCTGWEGSSFTWTLVEGPDISSSVSTWEDQVLRFHTRTLEDMRGTLPDTGGIIALSHDQAGEYVFQVSARNTDGMMARSTVLVTSANVTSNMSSVPTHDVQYMVGPKEYGPWDWKVFTAPKSWIITLSGEKTRTPVLQPIPIPGTLETWGQVTLRNETWREGILWPTEFTFIVAPWSGVPRDCGRSECHPAIQTSWEATRHANTWRKLVDGELTSERGPAAESCATCHTIGWDPSAKNDNYYYADTDPAVRFPQTQRAGNYTSLTERLRNVSNVYCLACHGPGRVDPPTFEQFGRFNVGVCARCHDRQPEQDLVAQWRTSRMSRTIKNDLNGAEERRECSRCHTAQGFYYTNFALAKPPSSGVEQTRCCNNLEPITCQACHSPMYARNTPQVFRYGDVRLRSGLDLKQIGSGALCVTCHTTDHDTADQTTLDNRLAPHSPQAELSYGHAGFALSVPAEAPALPTLEGVACSKTAGQGCVTCHMDSGPTVGQTGYREVGAHTFRMTSSEGQPNTRPCEACHTDRTSFDPLAGGDWDGDGVTRIVREEYRGLMTLVRQQLAALIEAAGYRGCDASHSPGTWFKSGDRMRLVVIDAQGFDLGDCNRDGLIYRDEQPFLMPDSKLFQAAYNYLLLELDGSQGLHNMPYAIKMLQRTLVALTDAKNLPNWEIYR